MAIISYSTSTHYTGKTLWLESSTLQVHTTNYEGKTLWLESGTLQLQVHTTQLKLYGYNLNQVVVMVH